MNLIEPMRNVYREETMLKKVLYLLVAVCLMLAAQPVRAEVNIQILHASDLEGGVAAIDNAPQFRRRGG